MYIQPVRMNPVIPSGASVKQPLRFTAEQTDPSPAPKPKQSAFKKWLFRGFIGSLLMVGGGGWYAYNAIPVIRNTTVNAAASGVAYQAKSASEKQAILWHQIQNTQYKTLPATDSAGVTGGSGLQKLDNVLKILDSVYIRNTFDQSSDVRPAHDKLFHPFAGTATVKWVPAKGHPYTGMFAGEALGVIRLSLATNQKEFMPGVGLKLLVDGQPSVNILAVPSLNPQGSNTDFFAHAPSNIFPAPQGAIADVVNGILTRAAGVPSANELTVDHFARITPEGSPVDKAVAPYQLELRPAGVHTPSNSTNDFRTDLSQIPMGSTLYEVWGKATAADKSPVHLGSLITTSPFVASQFADQELSFQHQR